MMCVDKRHMLPYPDNPTPPRTAVNVILGVPGGVPSGRCCVPAAAVPASIRHSQSGAPGGASIFSFVHIVSYHYTWYYSSRNLGNPDRGLFSTRAKFQSSGAASMTAGFPNSFRCKIYYIQYFVLYNI